MTAYNGACLCGDVTFEYRPPSLWCAHCHCSLCQRAHGAPLVTWVGVSQRGFALTKSNSLRWYRSSSDSERGFCANCGSTLFFRSERWPGQVHIVRSNIYGDIDVEPSAHVHCESQVHWFPFSDALPRESDRDNSA